MALYSLIINVPGKGLAAGREKMVEEQEETRRAREEHWAVWVLENSLETLVDKLRDSVTRQGVRVIM